jgi:Sulfatase
MIRCRGHLWRDERTGRTEGATDEPFKGIINLDIRDSEPDWAPFEPPKAPEGAPNVVYMVLDDVGFSAMSCYGGPIETPNIDRLAAHGVRFTQVAHHGTVLADPVVPADRAQPHPQLDGLHHRGGVRVP